MAKQVDGDLQRLLADLEQPGLLGRHLADGNGDGPVGAPAVEPAGGIDFEQVAFLEHALARDAVNDLLVDAEASDGGEWRLAGIALEQRDRIVLGVERFDRLIDLDGLDAGPGHLAADLEARATSLPGLAHEARFREPT